MANVSDKLIASYGNLDKLLLPDKKTLIDIVEGIRILLFPNHFGFPKLNSENANQIVSQRIETLKEKFKSQLCLAFGCTDKTCTQVCDKAQKIGNDFIEYSF